MNEDDIGKVFLISCPWDWTFVGRLAGFVGDRLVLHEAGYFTRTGATFNELCKNGFTPETRFNAMSGPKGELRVPNSGPIFPWQADWPQKQRGSR